MQNVGDIFTKLGGTGAVARMIDVKHSAASEMRRRQSIPVRYWPQLIAGAKTAGVEIDSDLLVKVHVAAAPAQENAA
ncbi:carph-isopro domain-containing protein [Mesorhizobium sp. M0134]|uniref:carph-isopro domain-containing protein n=1 Tax=unclassified Mesorhizobium TaxID=325217 RepID=UPI00333B09D3